ncbi:response regulator transcription factor [Thalassoroseus pseudoceratinae]|uniref:response regulator transcription factor n=1 Tax=Thalassoroseus pseudoceratinae TaxID=2713176 RepID=UPI0014234BBC|nr:response regulator [Thalassoroseus pseudoceratinae]
MYEPTVYLVDDDIDMRESLECLLQASGMQTCAFERADQFLHEYCPALMGCVIVDYQMPGMTGLELLERMQIPGEDALPAILMTAFADVPIAISAMKRGAIDLLEKPFQPEDLMAKVQEALSRDLQRQSIRSQQTQLVKKFERLTKRENETLELLRAGLPNKAIAAKLEITERAVEMRRARIMEKIEAQSIAELFEEFAIYRKLIEPVA